MAKKGKIKNGGNKAKHTKLLYHLNFGMQLNKIRGIFIFYRQK